MIETGRLRLFVVLGGLYLAQAIPSYLFAAALPPILRQQGVSRTAIGMFALLFVPLVIKFLWAPQVDRIRPLAIGHRAGWVFITQAGIIALIVALAFVPPSSIHLILGIGFAVSMLLSTQDIATDGYATRQLQPRDRPIGNAIQGGSVAFGVVIGGTMSLVLYDHLGWTTTILIVAGISLLPLGAALMMREGDPKAEARGPRPSFRAFLARPEARLILAVALIYRASEGLVKAMEAPYLVDIGVPLAQIGYLSGGAATTAGLAGSAIAALLIGRIGVENVLALLGGMRTICFAMFALHSAGWLGGHWEVFGAAGFQTLIRYMEIVALYSLFMAVSSSDQPGTDFTILSCAQLLVYLAGSMAAGVLVDRFGYPLLFTAATVISGVAIVATTWMLRGSVPAEASRVTRRRPG